jgi:cell division protein ZapA (FtsZ GTPase activity inhibitor)
LKRSVPVRIAGHTYSIRSDADESYVQALASVIDRRIRDIKEKGRSIEPQAAAVLVAMQLADELEHERRRRSSLRQRVREKARSLRAALAEGVS